MKRKRFLMGWLIVLLSFGLKPVMTQGETVDFGDSGITVVVEAEGGETNDDSGWAYWFPDEFYDYFPPLRINFPFPSFPGWAGGGGGDDGKDPCQAAKDKLADLYNQLGQVAQQINDAIEKAAPLTLNDKAYEAHSPGWITAFYKLMQQRDELKEQIEEAHQQQDTACDDQ
ncbi:MAG: hypothetical protein KC422_19825 [Trueperaceae bacterium]|nr:hypothetical protein [Trueperaceae bacterium]